jgi:hypothetical protein
MIQLPLRRKGGGRAALFLFAILMSSVACAQSEGTIELDVPAHDYAVLRFGQPVTQAVLPPDAPVDGKPYFMAGNRVLLLRFKDNAAMKLRRVQAVDELADGTTRVLSLMPRIDAQSQVDVTGTAPVAAPVTELAPASVPSRNPNAYAVDILSSLLAGGDVSGWGERGVDELPTLIYDRRRAIPQRAWSGPEGTMVVHYRLVAEGKQESLLDPSQFYREGVVAAQLIDPQVAPGHDGSLLLMQKTGAP